MPGDAVMFLFSAPVTNTGAVLCQSQTDRSRRQAKGDKAALHWPRKVLKHLSVEVQEHNANVLSGRRSTRMCRAGDKKIKGFINLINRSNKEFLPHSKM